MSKTLSISAPNVHSMFRGNVEKTVAKLDKLQVSGKIKNEEYKPRLEWIKTSELVPMETQRETKDSWVIDRQKRLDGVDMIALGCLSVAKDPMDQKYYVWDGCGRWAIVDTNGSIDTVPCIVYDMAKEKAAFYFAYNQEEGRRKLSREVTFVNAFTGGDRDAQIWAQRLDQIGCYIKANDTAEGQVNHNGKDSGYPEILYRALTDGFKIAKGDMSLQRQARDMIVTAWSTTEAGCPKIVTEVYWALIKLMSVFPDARKNGLNKSIQQYLNWLAQGKSQGGAAKDWKGKDAKGLSGNVGVAGQLAYAFAKSFKESGYWKGQYANTIVLSKLKTAQPTSPDDDSDSDSEE